MNSKWSKEEIKKWVTSQKWYQSIKIFDDLVTPGNFSAEKRLRLMCLGDLTGKRILDVGCNSGLLCFEAKKRNAKEVIGIDISEKRLKQAKTLAEIMNFNIKFMNLDIRDIDKLGKFDSVFCISVLTEISDLINSILKLKKITKETLFIELALSPIPNLPKTISKEYVVRELSGKCYLRKLNDGRWTLLPNMQFIKALLGDKFRIKNLGRSSRYSLIRCDIRK